MFTHSICRETNRKTADNKRINPILKRPEYRQYIKIAEYESHTKSKKRNQSNS